VDSESGLIHSVETTAAHVHDLTPAAHLLHGEETVVYADAGYQGIEKRSEMQGRGIGFRVAMRPGKRRALPDTPEGRLDDLVETAKAHIRAKVEHPFRLIKRQFGFQKNPAAWPAQEPLQGECAGSPLEPIHGTSQVVMQYVIWGVVCPLKGKIAPHGQDSASNKVKSGQQA